MIDALTPELWAAAGGALLVGAAAGWLLGQRLTAQRAAARWAPQVEAAQRTEALLQEARQERRRWMEALGLSEGTSLQAATSAPFTPLIPRAEALLAEIFANKPTRTGAWLSDEGLLLVGQDTPELGVLSGLYGALQGHLHSAGWRRAEVRDSMGNIFRFERLTDAAGASWVLAVWTVGLALPEPILARVAWGLSGHLGRPRAAAPPARAPLRSDAVGRWLAQLQVSGAWELAQEPTTHLHDPATASLVPLGAPLAAALTRFFSVRTTQHLGSWQSATFILEGGSAWAVFGARSATASPWALSAAADYLWDHPRVEEGMRRLGARATPLDASDSALQRQEALR